MKKQIILLGVALAALLVATSCNPIENATQSAQLLTVMSVMGVDQGGKPASWLASDVVDTSKGIELVSSDSASATVRNTPLDTNPVGGTSQWGDVQMTRYVVTFSRPNGASQPGVDVPFPIEGALNVTIPVNGEVTFGFLIVPYTAKLDPPLIQLKGGGDQIEVIAKIEFFGHDLSTRDVKTTGYLTIFFSDWYNEPK